MRLPAGEVDKYAIYEDFPVRRYAARLCTNDRIVDPEWVESQFFLWREDEDHVVIVPVFPVLYHTITICFINTDTLFSAQHLNMTSCTGHKIHMDLLLYT